MTMPPLSWRCTYAARGMTRQKCRACGVRVNRGELVIMARIEVSYCKIIHASCAHKIVKDGVTWAQQLRSDGLRYLAACGYPLAVTMLEKEGVS